MQYFIASRDSQGNRKFNMIEQMSYEVAAVEAALRSNVNPGTFFYPLPFNDATFAMATPLDKMELACAQLGIPIETCEVPASMAHLVAEMEN